MYTPTMCCQQADEHHVNPLKEDKEQNDAVSEVGKTDIIKD